MFIWGGSEIGRFPIKNPRGGKDHFPETTYFFIAPGLQKGKWGMTDRSMQSVKIKNQSEFIFPTINDIGCTLLHRAGIDNEVYGYQGRILDIF